MIETEINTHLESIKDYLRTSTREGDKKGVPMKSSVTEGLEFLWQYFKHPKNRNKYPVRFAETKRLLKIGVDREMLGSFDAQKLSLLEQNMQRSQSMMSDRSKQGKTQAGQLKASTDTSQLTEIGEGSKISNNLQYRQKEESLLNKIQERLLKMDKSREKLAVKNNPATPSNDQPRRLSKDQVSLKASRSLTVRETSEKQPKLPPISLHAQTAVTESSRHGKGPAEKTLRTLLRLGGARVEGARRRNPPKPVPHSFFSLLDRSREQSVERAVSASRNRSPRSEAPVKTPVEALKGPQYSLLWD